MPKKDKPTAGKLNTWRRVIREITGASNGKVNQLLKDGMTIEEIIIALREDLRNAPKKGKTK